MPIVCFLQTRADLLTTMVAVYKAMGGGWVAEADKLNLPREKKP